MIVKHGLFTMGLIALVAGCSASRPEPPPETVAAVDLDRYLGTWYEIAHIPNRFQAHCVRNTRAEYARDAKDRITVANRCIDKDGRLDEARGIARVVPGTGNAQLEVSFVSLFGWHLFWGDYWILDLDPAYQHVAVGSPDRRYGWILSRTPTLPTQTRADIDRRLTALGYDPARFTATAQDPPPR